MELDTDLPILTPAEARVLGCLIEKKELTPDVYPLTLNGAHGGRQPEDGARAGDGAGAGRRCTAR